MIARRRTIFFSITFVTLPFVAVAIRRGPVAFVTISAELRRRYGRWLAHIGVKQISEKDDLETERYHTARRNVIEAARIMAARHSQLGIGFAKIGGDSRFRDFATVLFIPSIAATAFMAPYMALRCESDEAATKLVSTATLEAFGPALGPTSLTRSRVGNLLGLVGFCNRIVAALLLAVFPVLNATLLWRKGVRPVWGGGVKEPSRPVIFVHREHELLDSHHKYRDMYFIGQGLLDAGDCQHILMATGLRFGDKKRKLLQNNGGILLEPANLRPSWRRFVRLVLLRHWNGYANVAAGILGCPDWHWASTRNLFEVLHFATLCPLILDQLDGQAVIFEGEVAPFVQILAIEARRRGRRTISMIHGSGAQHTVGPSRVEIQVEEMMTYGMWDDPLRWANPAIARCIPIGNIEIDEIDRSGKCLPELLKRRRRDVKIVAFLARLSHVLTTDQSSVSGSSYLEPAAVSNLRYLSDFFSWVGRRDDVVLVWKTTLDGFGERLAGGDIRWQPWLAPYMAAIPRERFVDLGDGLLSDIVGNCDLAVCNDVSSAFACALSAGTPALSIDFVFGGMLKKYHPRLAATSGAEIVENAEWLLANRLPESVFDQFNLDFYGMPKPDFNAAGRIKDFFDDVRTHH